MAPRRRSKRTAVQADREQDHDADNASQATERHSEPPSPSTSRAQIFTLPDDLDVEVLSELLPDISLDNPSPEAIISCYRQLMDFRDSIARSQTDVEQLESSVEKISLERDQALQDKESAVQGLEAAIETAQSELQKVTHEKDKLLGTVKTLQTHLSQVNQEQSTSTVEADSLKRKVEDTEREKRDLLGVISRLEEEHVHKDKEIQRLREDLKALRRDNEELETNSRQLRSSETSTKFKIDTLTQQLQLARDENERVNAEISTKSEEFSKYRREKHAEIVQLQSQLDTLTLTHTQTTSTLRVLQNSHTSQSHQLSQTLQKVQDLTGQLADQEAKYSSEAANLRRLVQMLEEREMQAKQLVEGIEKDWEGLGAKAAAREQKLLADLTVEQQRCESLEKQIEDMQIVMDKINRGEFPVPDGHRVSAYGRPSDVTPEGLYGLSPNLAMINRMQKSGKTFTQVYADYVRLEEEMSKKSLEVDRLDRTLAEVLGEIEERAPVLNQQRKDYERVQAESFQLAAQLAQAISERDGFALKIDEITQKLSKTGKENDLLQRQLEDLGRQVQALLREVARRDDPSIPPDEELESIPPAGDINAVISNNLVVFRSIPQLQELNQKLLRVTRELGAKMESEDREYKDALEREQTEAIREAHEAIQALQAQLELQQKNQQATVQAYLKERDTLKTMLARYERGAVPSDAAPHPNGISGAYDAPSDLKKELEEVQSNFDAYRREIGVDAGKLREEVLKYQREAHQLGAALAKANAKIDYLNERYKMAQDQYAVQLRDFESLSKRNQVLMEQYSRMDISCNHTAEELSIANGQIERLRNECANLRAEKNIWESVQARLVEENRVLSVERSRLSDLMGSVQKLHNDIDKSNEADRRRLESQIQSFDAQAQELRSQLSRERDAARLAAMQKDLDAQELRNKIERTSEVLAKTRESLAVAETSRKHLQDRVDDLAKQVQVNEEKLTVYERRTVSVTGGVLHASSEPGSEQQFKAEVAELRAALKAAEVDLATAKAHVLQFQEISQASEAALASLTATHDEYKVSAEAQLAAGDAQRKAAEEKLVSMQQEIDRLQQQYAELQQITEKERATFAADKKTLEDTIVDITNAEMTSRTDQSARESEVREQADRAKVAEEKYSHEVVAHAEAIRLAQSLKQELDSARSLAREQTTIAETAQANLSASEDSWKQQKEVLDKEIADLNARCKDLIAQNSLLHQHLESVSAQASRIRQAASTSISGATADTDADEADGRVAELRSVVTYLRKEKEIVDLQLELSKQENARLKAQIEHMTQNLEETRATLSAEREQAARALENSTEHSDLIERINQLNILRESNATLRAEGEAHARRARQLETSLAQLTAELEPAKEEARVARAEVEEKDRQITRLEGENRQWKERSTQLLSKYNQIDPSEMQALRDEIEDLQIDARKYEEAQAAQAKELDEQRKLYDSANKQLTDVKSKYDRVVLQTRERIGSLNSQIAQLKGQVMELTAEKEKLANQAPSAGTDKRLDLEAQVDTLTKQKEAAEKALAEELEKSAKVVAEKTAELTTLRAEVETLRSEKAGLESSLAVSTFATAPGPPDVEAAKAQFEAEKAELQKALEDAKTRVQVAEDRATKSTSEAREVRLQNEKFQARIIDAEKRKGAEAERLATLLAKHKEEQEAAVTAATEKLRAELQAPGANTQEVVTARHAEELKALEARLQAKYEEELKVLHAKLTEAATKIEEATERGRKEVETKLKLKDQLLAKKQKAVKDLETQIQAWRAAGFITEATAAHAAGPSSAPNAATPSAPAATSVTSTPAAAVARANVPPVQPPAALAGNALPRKPSMAGPSEAAARGGRGGVVRGRGHVRGAPRGAAPARGGAPAAAATAAAHAATTSASSMMGAAPGISIVGAAAKRGREDPEGTESLAKRIKPAETAVPKPIALRRDRIPPANPPQPPPS